MIWNTVSEPSSVCVLFVAEWMWYIFRCAEDCESRKKAWWLAYCKMRPCSGIMLYSMGIGTYLLSFLGSSNISLIIFMKINEKKKSFLLWIYTEILQITQSLRQQTLSVWVNDWVKIYTVVDNLGICYWVRDSVCKWCAFYKPSGTPRNGS